MALIRLYLALLPFLYLALSLIYLALLPPPLIGSVPHLLPPPLLGSNTSSSTWLYYPLLYLALLPPPLLGSTTSSSTWL